MLKSGSVIQDLVERATQGDAGARGELFDHYREYLLRMVTAR